LQRQLASKQVDTHLVHFQRPCVWSVLISQVSLDQGSKDETERGQTPP
jgi:hypothetical protein